MAVAGHEIIFAPYGELGPLDVQVLKEDQIGSHQSGLNISEAFSAIEGRAKDTFHSLVGEIFAASQGAASIRTALHAANEIVASLYGPVLRQIDPEEVGSRSRAMRIGEDYARRLTVKSQNLKPNQVNTLSRSYPDHGFVIDYAEAQSIFENVRMANESELEIAERLDQQAIFQQSSACIKCVIVDEVSEHEEASSNGPKQSQRRKGKGAAGDGSNFAQAERVGRTASGG